MFIAFFCVVLALQIYLYVCVDNKKITKSKTFITLMILGVYFLLPFIINFAIKQNKVVSDPNYIETNCLLPVVSLFVGLWLFGFVLTVITAFIYSVYKKISK